MDRRQHVRQHVLGPVLGLASEQVNLCLAPLTLGNVSGDFRCTDDFAATILDGGDRQGNIDQAFVLALTNGFIVVYTFAIPDAVEDSGLLVTAIWWKQNRDGLADDLFSEVAENSFSALVPAGDCAIEAGTYDCIVTGLDDGSEPPGPFLSFAQHAFDLHT